MKNKLLQKGIGIALSAAIALSGCSSIPASANGMVAREGDAASVTTVSSPTPAQLSPETLSEDEAAGLLFMREEEKLAHDVYMTLYAKWQLPIFQNIARSEQTHSDAVLGLLTRYGLADPTVGLGAGEFADPALQSLYNQLVAQGSESLDAALRVGAAIEEIDILDLEERLAQTNKADIARVYNSLLAGSHNHLRAFVGTLEQQTGASYAPQYLAPAAYAAIMDGAAGQGNGRNDGGNGGQDGRNNGSRGRGNTQPARGHRGRP